MRIVPTIILLVLALGSGLVPTGEALACARHHEARPSVIVQSFPVDLAASLDGPIASRGLVDRRGSTDSAEPVHATGHACPTIGCAECLGISCCCALEPKATLFPEPWLRGGGRVFARETLPRAPAGSRLDRPPRRA